MTVLWLAMAGFALGSLPFSVWLLRWVSRVDVRRIGDGNPGAANAWKGGGPRLGFAVLLLDVLKAAAAPAVARSVFGLDGWLLVPVALAPVFGHVFSPWLRFRGGKGIASTFGAWSALTYWLVPAAFGAGLVLFLPIQSVSAWTVALSGGLALAVLAVARPEPPLLAAFAVNLGLLLWTHRRELRQAPRFHAPRMGRKR